MHAGTRRAAGVLLFAAAVALALWLLHLLAVGLVTRELGREAATDQAAWSAGTTPWHWQLRRPGDVVAGRAFGAAELIADADGLRVRSLDGSAYEIGLPLSRDADLLRAPRLRVTLAATRPPHLWLVLRQRLDGPLCMAAVRWPSGGRDTATWSLDTLRWARPGGVPCARPVRAALLRVRVQQAAGGTVRFGAIALLPRADLQIGHAIRLSAAPDAARRQAAELAAQSPAGVVPRIRLPVQVPAQRLLALRDMAHAALPAAIVLPATSLPAGGAAAHVAARPSPVRAWAGLGAYTLVLVYLALWPPRGRWRPWLQAAACVAGPLWLVAGLHLGLHTAPAHAAAFVLGLAFAAWIEFRSGAIDWRWIGAGRDWLWPLLPLAAALALALAFSRGVHAPSPGRLVAYLGWASLQQWLMLAVVLRRLRVALPAAPAAAVFVCAIVFGLLHTPNAQLMLLCFVAELWWGWCFLRSRALLPVAVAHAACALLLQATLAGGWLRSLEVSARYFLGP
jgi:hypothetical protein